MNRIQKLLIDLWPFELGAKISVHGACLFGMLTSLRDAGTRVTVKFQDDSGCYDCKIMALSAKHHVIVIDKFQPAVPAQLLTRGNALTIEAVQEGRKITLDSQFLEPLTEYRHSGYLLKVF